MPTGKNLAKLKNAYEKDPKIFTERGAESETFGSNPDYLRDVFNITKNDLIRLEREGLAIKARYETRHPKAELYEKLNEARTKIGQQPIVCQTGTHRVRWIIFKEAINAV